MAGGLIQFSKFASLYNRSDETRSVSLAEIKVLEDALKIKLPDDFKLFMQTYGSLWTPDILDIIVDNDIDMHDIQQFWPPDEIIEDKKSGITNQIELEDLIPFASDCMGNIYAFKTNDIRVSKPTATVYFFDLDFNENQIVAQSFTELIEEFNALT
jgi:hypothetical protein